MPGPAWVWNLWRECSGVLQELKLGGGGGVSPDRVGAGRPRGWQGRGWTGQRLGAGAARLSEHSTSTHYSWASFGPHGSSAGKPGAACREPERGSAREGGSPGRPSLAPRRGPPCPPPPPGTESSRPLFFPLRDKIFMSAEQALFGKAAGV